LLILTTSYLQAQQANEFEKYLHSLTDQFEIEQIKADSVILSKAIILDTREKEEFTVSRIKNAIFVGYDDFDPASLDSIKTDEEIIVYCSVGYRSSIVGVELKKNGFKNVKNLYGGLFKWANEGRPLYNDSTQTLKIHTYNKKWGRFITNPDLIKID
jgi:rhodanese-related sulfurtransferase